MRSVFSATAELYVNRVNVVNRNTIKLCDLWKIRSRRYNVFT